MKQYPKIYDSSTFNASHCIAFNKYDGSNLRAEWRKKQGFYKFGTRKRLFDEKDEVFGCAIPLFMDKFSKKLEEIFSNNKIFHGVRDIICFAEFFGENSFAGQHVLEEEKKLVLFDVWLYKKGLIGPKDFVKLFSNNSFESAKVVYEGKFTGKLIEDVRKGVFKDKGVFEGVICKSGEFNDIQMCKVKTNEYLEKLKVYCSKDWADFWE